MKPPRLRCALVGADTLLIECARLLLDRGHEIAMVAAGSTRVADWATQAGLPVYSASEVDNWADNVRTLALDHLFAITHLELLPAKVVAAVAGMAINFHDGPLPQYAGLNTPVWGILRDEREWGISWHRIDDGIDSGEVLVQRRFAIAERETALSLNTRNFEEAIESFAEVLDRLESAHTLTEPLSMERQDADAPRTLFLRGSRPDGILDFTQPAADVDRVVRALHFGPHPNPIAAAVLWHPGAAVVVESSEIVDPSRTDDEPGTLLTADNDGLTIACSLGVIGLHDLRWLDGTRCTAPEFVATVGAEVGRSFPQLSIDQRQWLTNFAASSQGHEATTVARLSALTPAEFPWPHRVTRASTARSVVDVPVAALCTPEHIVNSLGVLLGRLMTDGGLDVALAQPLLPEFARPLICCETVLDLKVGLTSDAVTSWRRDLIARTPRLAGRPELLAGLNLPIGIRVTRDASTLEHAIVVLQPSAAGKGWEVEFDPSAVERSDAAAFARCLAAIADANSAANIALLSAEDEDRVIHQWNSTDVSYEPACIHDLIAQQAARTPLGEAVMCGDEVLTYQELIARSNGLAAHLQRLGVGPESLVGVHVDRGIDLVVAVLAVLQAGGGYVPLDPAYPGHRLQHMIADSKVRVIVCQEKDRGRLPLPADDVDRTIVAVDFTGDEGATTLQDQTRPHNLAYCMYTSGSAGAPKGVLIEHRSVANLFLAMDSVVQRCPDETGRTETWCAVTSLSFDISVLELLYTLARGIRIALHAPSAQQAAQRSKTMDYSLFYFSADEAGNAHDPGGKYRLLLDGARFADANGFSAVWTPERHFHAFGGLYPNPAVTAAAIATVTERVSIRAGSVVLPLHHPVEIAEAWSMVDNLSSGRAGVAFASGWQPNDFVLRPQNYSQAKATMFEGIEQIRRLWRGETLAFEGPDNKQVAVATLPRPVQAELPMWITTAGDPDSFAAAGTVGANLLTHLVGQSIDQLATKIASYRAARAAAGHDPSTGVVTLMLHTFVGDDEHAVRATVREPLRTYLNTSFNLIREHAWSFPTFRRPDGAPVANPADLADADIANLAGDDLNAVLDFAAERYYETSGLFGTPDQVLARVERLQDIGVDEVACLVDFGIATDTVLAHLPHLARVRTLATNRTVADPSSNSTSSDATLAEFMATTGTTHMQCTPSMARMLTLDPAMRTAFGALHHLLVGGEALPPDLAHELQALVGGTVTNMYGPTETTVWSSAWTVGPGFAWTPIGTPIVNTQLYVLDNIGQPTPPGVAGQLWIGGEGVARGYHQQPDLNEERFRANPFRDGRMYSTGDLARWQQQPDGSAMLEFLGRSDQQVKLRGHRIELGEVEAEMRRLDSVLDCAAVIRERADDPFNQQLIAYVVAPDPAFDASSARETLRTRLPEIMVPSYVGVLSALPRTPNGKVDRRALAAQPPSSPARPALAPAEGDMERLVLASWCHVLGTDALGVDDNFFDVGGHSLLVVRLHRHLQEALDRTIALTDLYRFPTVRTFSASLTNSSEKSAAVAGALDRAARRRATSRGRS